jgi:hypothetical protein
MIESADIDVVAGDRAGGFLVHPDLELLAAADRQQLRVLVQHRRDRVIRSLPALNHLLSLCRSTGSARR